MSRLLVLIMCWLK